jgi:RNA polymerase sigma-70 factor (ECF subfamily)
MTDIRAFSDEKLVEAVRSQDQELYREVVMRYQKKLLRYATYLVGDTHKAEDVVQVGFIKAFQNLQGFDTSKKFSSWIYRIIHNESLNAIKKNQAEINLEEGHWQVIESSVDIEAEYDKKEVSELIKKSLNKLPSDYKAPLTLYYLEDRSYEEISDILRMPIGTVGTRINRGKAMLKNTIKK